MAESLKARPAPNPHVMRDQLDAAFGAFDCIGLVEIAHSGSDGGAINRARLFPNTVEGRAEAAKFAAERNAEPGVNLYFAPSLRCETANRGKRATKADVLGSPLVWADCDAEGSADAVKSIYEAKGCAPHLAVVTGRAPAKRAQVFWRLDGLVTDQGQLDEMLAGVHVGLGFFADPKVVNADRVMRLAGSIAWPKPGKEGRAIEVTELHRPGAAPAEPYAIERLTAVFPRRDPVAARKGHDVPPGGDLLALPAPAASPVAGTSASAAISAPSPQAAPVAPAHVPERESDMLGRRIEGRETYARDVIGGAIRNLAAKFGRWPTADELFAEAWQTFERACGPKNPAGTLEAEGRGPTWFREKCATHAARAARGAIPGLDTIEKCREAAAMNSAASPVAQFAQASPLPAFGARPRPPRPFAISNFASIPRREFLYGKHYIREFVSATISPGGVGKSSLGLVEAVAMATGRPLLGVFVERPLRVLNWNLEDPRDESDRRVAGILQHYGLSTADLGGRLFLESGRDNPLTLAAEGRAGTVVNEDTIEFLVEFARAERLDVIQFDPFVSAHKVNENDNNAIDAVVKALARVASRAGMAIEIVHHSRKAPSGERESVTTDDDARGAGAIKGGARAMRALNRMTRAEAQRFGIDEARARSFVRIDDGKQNLAPPSDRATWFQIVGEALPNGGLGLPGDNVGVVEPWTPPSAFEGVTTDHARAVRAAAGEASSTAPFRESDQAKEWIGHKIGKIVGFGTTEKAGKARARAMLKAWIENEILAIEHRWIDGKSRPVVVPGPSGFSA